MPDESLYCKPQNGSLEKKILSPCLLSIFLELIALMIDTYDRLSEVWKIFSRFMNGTCLTRQVYFLGFFGSWLQYFTLYFIHSVTAVEDKK